MTSIERATLVRQFAAAVEQAALGRLAMQFSQFEEKMRAVEISFIATAKGDEDLIDIVRRRVASVLALEAMASRHQLPFEKCLLYFHRQQELGFHDRHFEWKAVMSFSAYCYGVNRCEDGLIVLEKLLQGPDLAAHELTGVLDTMDLLRNSKGRA